LLVVWVFAMLAAEKAFLRAQTTVDVSIVRSKEIDYYSSQLGILGTQSALLAAMAFSALVWEKSIDNWADEGITEVWWQGSNPFTGGVRDDWNARKWWTYACHVVNILLLLASLMQNLWVMQSSVVASLLGNGLALRGPPGSIDRAATQLAHALSATAHRFVSGIHLFGASTAFYVLEVFTPFISLPAILVLVIIWHRVHSTVAHLGAAFRLNEDQVITGRFRAGEAAPDVSSLSERPPTMSWMEWVKDWLFFWRVTWVDIPVENPRASHRMEDGVTAEQVAEALIQRHQHLPDDHASFAPNEDDAIVYTIGQVEATATRLQRWWRGVFVRRSSERGTSASEASKSTGTRTPRVEAATNRV